MSGVCVTNKTGFGFDDRIYWTFPQTSYNISQITTFDWTFSTSDHTALTHYSLSLSSKIKVILRLTVSQLVSLGVGPHLGLMTR
jgi:hypothetical protein